LIDWVWPGLSVPLITSKFNHDKPPVCADQDAAWLPPESVSGCVDDPLRGVKLKLRAPGFTLGGLGVAAGLDGTGVGDGAGVADGFEVGNGDADFEVGDSKDDVNEVVLLCVLFDVPRENREGSAARVAIIIAHRTAAINHRNRRRRRRGAGGGSFGKT
jgi:hypothetical protein